ncbi:unnamed protein product [Effrenium voratum]|uniref:Uncharacterized protein n=1 Tax=Effrenium voratum TaxID=2562239 RepID=A0AA36IWY2_9DINO|nr:unnamed protein product [Effrenium voratum]
MSKVIILLGEAAGPLELTRLGLCSRGLARQVFEPSFSSRLCRQLSVQDVDLDLEMLSVCLALRKWKCRGGPIGGSAIRPIRWEREMGSDETPERMAMA